MTNNIPRKPQPRNRIWNANRFKPRCLCGKCKTCYQREWRRRTGRVAITVDMDRGVADAEMSGWIDPLFLYGDA